MKYHFALSYRALEEMMDISPAKIDDATLQRWIIKFVPLMDQVVRKIKGPVRNSWKINET